MHSKHDGFVCSTSGSFTKTKEVVKKLKKLAIVERRTEIHYVRLVFSMILHTIKCEMFKKHLLIMYSRKKY